MALKFRRGSTAQQSGSLAFGEPYVNTTLGTLVIGGATGDIVLSAGGTGSTGNFGAISGSGLDITGNANIAGNLTLGGAITIGDATADTVNVVASLSSSLIPQTTNAFDLGSASKIWRDLYISTGSIKFVEGNSVVKTLSAATLTALEVATGSSNTSVAALNSFSSSQLTQNTALATISGSLILTASANSVSVANLNTYTSSNDTTNTTQTSRLDQLSTASGSAITRLTALEVETSNLESFTSSINTTIKSKLDTDGVVSGSSQVSLKSTTGFSAFDTALSTISGSLISSASAAKITNDSQDISITNLNSTTASLTQRVAANEAVSGTFARTNSTNTFNGNQTVSGSLTVTQDFVVLGSSSIQNISSSILNIGTNLITVAVNNPSVRFGGLSVIDSGSAGGSGSFLYDSVQDEFIFVHRGNGTNVTSSHFVLGPETYDNLGNETYLTNNRLSKGSGKEHLNDSQITDDGTTVTIPGALTVTGNITGPIRATNGVVSGSSQITYASISSIPGGIVSGSSQINGITNAQLSNSSITIAGQSTALGTSISTDTIRTAIGTVVTGSAQITLASTNGFGTYLNQAVLTSASPTFAGLTINGAITATGDITAFFTSDKRHKNTIQTISNAVLKVKQLNGVTWEWNDDVNEVTKSTPKTGLIAQEVQQVLPQVVIERPDGFLALDYSKMVGLLVEAIKEQQIQIDQLKAQIGSK
jgi:hypothetical protein